MLKEFNSESSKPITLHTLVILSSAVIFNTTYPLLRYTFQSFFIKYLIVVFLKHFLTLSAAWYVHVEMTRYVEMINLTYVS